MDEYIKREALLEAIDTAFDESPVEDTTAWMKGRRIVRTFPAADVEEVKHGEWEDDADDIFWGNYIVKKHCSECGYTPEFDRETELFNLTKRCPECGAKMDGKREEQNK